MAKVYQAKQELIRISQFAVAPILHHTGMADLSQLYGRTLVLVAHPDDECIACGAILQRMSEAILVFATDGSPRDSYFWGAHGSREAYSELRRQEARRALTHVGVSQVEFLSDDAELGEKFVDQELFQVIPDAYRAIAKLLDRYQPDALLTLAYEGGHPDHDTCNFLAAQLSNDRNIPAWESALYNRSDGAEANSKAAEMGHANFGAQHFVHLLGNEISINVSGAELDRKIAMCREYPSQGDFLGIFEASCEVLRPLAPYDYTVRPHQGALNYERWQWSMTGADVCAAFRDFMESRAKGSHGDHQHTTRTA